MSHLTDWDEKGTTLALQQSLDGSCLKLQVGAVVLENGILIGHGHNGAPVGLTTCVEAGVCLFDAAGRCIRTVHAEARAVIGAGKSGVFGGVRVLYTTMLPCLDCSKLILDSSIRRVVYMHAYDTENPLFNTRLYLEQKLVLNHWRGQ